MIELYGSPTPSTCTIAIMLEEAAFHYSIFPVNKNNGEHLDLEFLKMTPANIFPIIIDRDGPEKQPLVIFESGAILIYLAEKSGKLIPQKGREKYEVLQWLLFENARIGPTLGNTKHFMYHAPEEASYAVKRFNNDAKRLFSILEKQLSENAYLAGEYSIADIATYPWVKEYERYNIDREQVPNLCAWLNKIESRPSVMNGLEALKI